MRQGCYNLAAMSFYYLIAALVLAFLLLLAGPLLFGRLFMPRLTLTAIKRFGKTVARIVDRIQPGLDLKLLVKAGNRYFSEKFSKTPFPERSFFIPICLCPPLCPAEITREEGVICTADCPDCRVGELVREARALGYGRVYVVPSSRLMPEKGLMPSDQFIKSKLRQEDVSAALGLVCGWHLRNRLLPAHSVGSKGYDPEGEKKKATVLQGVLLDQKKCRGGTVNWEEVLVKLRQSSC